MPSPLFEQGRFQLHSGAESTWRINCTAFYDRDWACLAELIAQRVRFYAVIGVPRGGLMLAKALERYADPQQKVLLIVDDVLTTGTSIQALRAEYSSPTVGFVVFDRSGGRRPKGVEALWVLTPPLDPGAPAAGTGRETP